MYTIKILTTDSDYLLENEEPAFITQLFQGNSIFHRSYMVKDEKEFKKWQNEHFIGENIFKSVIGIDPSYLLERMDGPDPFVYFEYLQFCNSDNQWHYCIICHAKCYIMNESGQTIDQFSN